MEKLLSEILGKVGMENMEPAAGLEIINMKT